MTNGTILPCPLWVVDRPLDAFFANVSFGPLASHGTMGGKLTLAAEAQTPRSGRGAVIREPTCSTFAGFSY